MLTVPIAVLAAALLVPPTTAATPESAPAAALPLPDVIAKADELPPPRRLGVRAHAIRESQRVRGSVVVVPDAHSAAEAIAAWEWFDRYPVLIDDGSDAAAENIGRFVRAFQPRSVVRWQPEDGRVQEIGSQAPTPARLTAWYHDAIGWASPKTGPESEDASAVTMRDIVRRLAMQGVTPHGVVAIDPRDDAWVAGLAVAAARLCPLIMVEPPGRVDGAMTPEHADALAASIRSEIDGLNLLYDRIGDDVDALLLCANSATRIRGEGNESFALTDRVTRMSPDAPRWAWAGQIFGDAQTSLYRAMCGLFLTTESAWLFDGYPDERGWNQFDTSRAEAMLKEIGLGVNNHDTPANTVADWHRATSRPIEAGLLLVNSKGGTGDFQVIGGRIPAGDVPLLARPAAMVKVHSFSAARPANRATVAGRWLERGVYAYYGSVHEPLLSAFVPTPITAARLLSGVALGAAVRLDDGPAWKLNLLADPMVTFVPHATGGRRVPEEPGLDDMISLAETVEPDLRGGSFVEALRSLVMLGEEAAAARLAANLIEGGTQPPLTEAELASVAGLAVLPAFRSSGPAAVLLLAEHLGESELRSGAAGDAVWAAARAARASAPTAARAVEPRLRVALRVGQELDDGIELASFMRTDGRAAEARALLQSLERYAKGQRDRRRLERALTARP